ncbi:MAG: Lrp/AsnC family transcriptional regulator [Acidimicrobiales bacterium]|nr:Lrp/AsnC family transcriptional regulator [Acidimicrobiales bacterium]
MKAHESDRRSGEPELDDIDKAIIRELQQDGRMSYADLGPAVGLSQAAVRQRVQRLIERNVMQVVAVTDPTRVGFSLQAMLGITAEGDVRAVAAAIAAVPEMSYVVITAGRYDILAEVVARDADALLDLVNERIRSIPGVTRTETLTYLRLEKQTYAWGTA